MHSAAELAALPRPTAPPSQQQETVVQVLQLDTLDAVRQIARSGALAAGETVCALIFASDTNPGGSSTASNVGTQEESICRRSTLNVVQRQLAYPIPGLGTAYIPHVQALMEDGVVQLAAVCAALRSCFSSGTGPEPKEEEFVKSKVRSVLDTAILHGHRFLVLGAWGCGAFGNPTDAIARLFKEVLRTKRYRGAFVHVVFAVQHRKQFAVFQEVLLAK